MEIYGWIYKITNNINHKFYIGQTKDGIKFRFERHINDSTGRGCLQTHLARAIRKYGSENFSVEEIDKAYSQKELTNKEYKWIKKLDAVHKGYNETDAKYKCGDNTYMTKTSKQMKKIKSKITLLN